MSKLLRKRGRPVGSCIDDSEVLNAMADLMLANSTLKPTRAINQILANPRQSLIHRLRSKWKAQHEDLIAKATARKRREQEEQIRRAHEMSVSMIDRSAHRRLGSLYGDAVSRAIGSLSDPHLQFIREHERASKFSQEMLSTADSIRRSVDLATISGIRNAVDSPALRAIHEMDKAQKQI